MSTTTGGAAASQIEHAPETSVLDRRDLAAITVLTVLALGLCLWRIDGRSLWLDEAFSIAGSGELRESWHQRGGSMAIYYAFLSIWTDQYGSIFWVRLPSAVFAAATIPFAYLTAKLVAGRDVAVLAALFLATSYGFIRYGQEARSYSLVLLLVTISWWLFVKLLSEPIRPGVLVSYGCVLALATYAHPFALLAAAPQGLVLLAHPKPRELLRDLAPGLALAFVLQLPLLQVALTADSPQPTWIAPLNTGQLNKLRVMLAGSTRVAALTAAAWLVGSALCIRSARAKRHTGTGWRALVPVLWFWTPIVVLVAVSIVRPYLVPKYLIATLPAGCLLAAIGVLRLPRPLAILAVVALLLASASGAHRIWSSRGEPWGEVAQLVSDQGAPPGVLFWRRSARLPFEHAVLAARIEDGSIPIYPSSPWGTFLRYFPPEAVVDIQTRLAEIDTLWVVDREAHRVEHRTSIDQILDELDVRSQFCLVEEHTLRALLALRFDRRTGPSCP